MGIKLFVGIALIINIILLFFVPIFSGVFPYLVGSVILLGIIWGIAKYL